MHLDDERIQRLLHDELEGRAREESVAHLAACADCTARVEDARREEDWIHGMLRLGDGPVPVSRREAVVRRARRVVVIRRLRWAAAAALVMGGAAIGYTMPGSPLRAWVDRIVERIVPGSPGDARKPAGAPEEEPMTAGIAVRPEGTLTIRFAAAQEAGEIAIRIVESDEASVRVVGGEARLLTSRDAIIVQNAGSSARYEVEIPRGAQRVEVLVGARRVASIIDGRIDVAPAQHSGVVLRFPLSP